MSKKKLAVIGANEPLIEFYKQASKLGYEIYSFAWPEGAVCKKYAKQFFPISFTEKDDILKKCKELKIDGITSFSLESALPTVLYVAEKLNLVSNSLQTLEYTGDKFQFREKCSQNAIPSLKYWLISEKKESNLKGLVYPVIVKPNDGGGAKGISLVNNSNQMKLATQKAMSFSKTKKVLVEEYIAGREVSAVFFTYKGTHHFIALTDKITSGAPNFVELAHSQPTNLSDETIEKTISLIQKVLDILEIKVGVTSIDLRITAQGDPVIIEVNPRLGGNNINTDLVKLSTGFDIIKAHCEVVCGQELTLPHKMKRQNAQVIYYTPKTQWLKKFAEKNQDNIIRSNLKSLNRICSNNSERSGYIIYNGEKRININEKMKKVKTLQEDFFLNKIGLKMRLVQEQDAEFILSLRANPNRTEFMVTLDNNIEKQKEWIKEYKKREQEGLDYYFLFENKERKLGVIRISHIDKQNKIAKAANWIKIPSDRALSIKMFALHKYVIFDILNLEKFYSDIHLDNMKSLWYYKKFGFPFPEKPNDRGYLDFVVTKEDFKKGIQQVMNEYNFNLYE